MGTSVAFREETRFVVEHWADIAILRHAIEAAESDIGQVLVSLEEPLTKGEWLDDVESGWEVQLKSYDTCLRVYRKKWMIAGHAPKLGIDDFWLDGLVGPKDRPWSFVSLPKWARSDANTKAIRSAVGPGTKPHGAWLESPSYPVSRYLDLTAVAADSSALTEALLEEFGVLARAVPAIDALVARVRKSAGR